MGTTRRAVRLGLPFLVLWLGSSSASATIVIDDFLGPALFVEVPVGGTTASGGVATGTDSIGGARAFVVTGDPVWHAYTTSGRLIFAGSSQNPAEALLIYDGGTDGTVDAGGLGGVDLTEGGASSLIGIPSFLDGSVEVTIYSDGSHYSSLALPCQCAPILGTPPGPTLPFMFQNFAAGAGAAGPADFANVGAITIRLSTSGGALIDPIYTAAPEPTTALTLALGIAALTFRRSRSL